MIAQSTSAGSCSRPYVVVCPDALMGLNELRQVSDVGDESERELLE